MDKLVLKNMTFHAYHGEFKVERTFGQAFDVDVELFFDARAAGLSDDIHDTINIYRVYEIVEQIMLNGKEYNLIEAIAETLASELLKSFEQLHEILIRVRKYKAAVKGILDYAEIEIRRCRQNVL